MRHKFYSKENIRRFGAYYLSGYKLGMHGVSRGEILEDRTPEEIASDEFWRGYREALVVGAEGGWLVVEADEFTSP